MLSDILIERMKAIILFYLVLVSLSSAGQHKARNIKQEIAWMKTSLLKHHVAPKIIDDRFSSDVFVALIGQLDPHKTLFTEVDILWLQPHRTLIDDEINGKDTGFLNRLAERYKSGLERRERIANSIMGSGLNWKTAETYDPRSPRSKDETSLQESYRLWIKHLVLERMVELMDRDSAVATDFFDKHLSEAVDYVHRTHAAPFTRKLKDPEVMKNELTTVFLQAVARIFDPHTDFFSTHDYDDFVASLSTEDYYFGFMLGEDEKGNVVITALTPGGAAWKSGALHVSDVLLAIKWESEDPVQLAGMNLQDVNKLLDSGNGDLLEMTIRTIEGREDKVTLRKTKIQHEENVVQSFVLDGAARIGFLHLPDFYTRWGNEGEGSRCANDVAREIIKLKKEGIEGLILDLRFNGGGSLYEAAAMAGIFIDEGPLAMVSTRDQKAITIKDMNRGTVYDGPLIILVNGSSASASEVLAGTIQDYHRGLIVGSQTYGKATGQNIFPLDGLQSSASAKAQTRDPIGYLKVTTQRLYRVTGKSAQGRGVTPDISLPDFFSALNLREDQAAFSLSKDSIDGNKYFKPLKPLTIDELKKRSRERVNNSAVFDELGKMIARLADQVQRDSLARPLLWSEYIKDVRREEDRGSAMDQHAERPTAIYQVSNVAAKQERLAIDDYGREVNERWVQQLTNDIYLQETYRILLDQITLTKEP
jgi:carboxyl-terminal processing protease